MAGSESGGEEKRPPGVGFGGERRVRVRIHGMVQGVGFRPFLFRLARERGVGGWARNGSDGVEAEVSGRSSEVANFIRDVSEKAPPLARVVGVEVGDLPFILIKDFKILESHEGGRATLVSPDVAVCEDCLRELFDPNDRRWLYPFVNCTNCGPRYTIIRDVPYDRDKTTMAAFAMCPECRAEYENPGDRRFHAQPNACPKCGPVAWLEAARGGGRRVAEGDVAVREAARLLGNGAIVAVKGLGGFHLAVDAANGVAVARLRERKVREEKPFAVMFRDIDAVEQLCRVSEEEARLLQGARKPIVLLERRGDSPEGGRLASGVAPGNRRLGVFLPYTPLHYLLFAEGAPGALVMTSGNRSDEPIAAGNDEARERLGGIADYLLMHNREIHMRCDDSVARVARGSVRLIRRARGWAPSPVFLGEELPPVLGVGAEVKNSVCLIRGREAFLSQHIGDLENLETLHAFEETIGRLRRLFGVRPELIAHDLHPDYLGTRWAEGRRGETPLLGVQHHHAHIASVVAERKAAGPVLGLALDGTGYGTDGTLWGGELLLVDRDRFERLGRLRHMALPGGDRAVREPWRMAVSCLYGIDPTGFERWLGNLPERAGREKVRLIVQMMEKGVNAPLTSSCGRLFDAAASLLGIRDAVSYEGQAAIELEQAVEPEDGAYGGFVRKDGASWVMDPLHMLREMMDDVQRGARVGTAAARFHNGVAAMLCEAVREASRDTGLRRVALSGGVFQNAYLSERLESLLAEEGLEVLTHEEAPPNDACIALGQAFVAACHLMRERGELDGP
ncbi:MAG: carbamoyltransferase HypF [Syntrophobacteraceae bacterium]